MSYRNCYNTCLKLQGVVDYLFLPELSARRIDGAALVQKHRELANKAIEIGKTLNPFISYFQMAISKIDNLPCTDLVQDIQAIVDGYHARIDELRKADLRDSAGKFTSSYKKLRDVLKDLKKSYQSLMDQVKSFIDFLEPLPQATLPPNEMRTPPYSEDEDDYLARIHEFSDDQNDTSHPPTDFITEEDTDLARAIALSLQENEKQKSSNAPVKPTRPPKGKATQKYRSAPVPAPARSLMELDPYSMECSEHTDDDTASAPAPVAPSASSRPGLMPYPTIYSERQHNAAFYDAGTPAPASIRAARHGEIDALYPTDEQDAEDQLQRALAESEGKQYILPALRMVEKRQRPKDENSFESTLTTEENDLAPPPRKRKNTRRRLFASPGISSGLSTYAAATTTTTTMTTTTTTTSDKSTHKSSPHHS